MRWLMIIDGLFIYHLIRELNQNLMDARLEKIYQTKSSDFLFVFYRQGQRSYLELSLDPETLGLFMSDSSKQDRESSQFLITLKKHLESAILKEITQHQTDRVIIFDFIIYDFIDGPVPIKLIVELMGRYSNLLLVKDQKLIESYKKMFFEEGRQLIPQASFEFFPSDKKPFTTMTKDDFDNPKVMLDRIMGISPSLASYMFEHRVLPLDIKLNPTRLLSTSKAYIADIFPLDLDKKHYQTISELFLTRPLTKQKSTSSHELFIERQLAKQLKKKEMIELSLTSSIEKQAIKSDADLIYQSLIPLDEKRSSISVFDRVIELDPNLTLNENAQKLYALYHKAKRAVIYQQEQLELTLSLIETFQTFQTYYHISNLDQLSDLEEELKLFGYMSKSKVTKKKKHDAPKISKIIDEDATYYIGKNSKQNDYLIHQIANRENYWFHVKDAPGGHIVVQTEKLTEKVLRKAAKLAALFSDFRYSSSIPIDYTQIKFLKKIPGKPGFNITYKSHQTIYIDLDEGFIKEYTHF